MGKDVVAVLLEMKLYLAIPMQLQKRHRHAQRLVHPQERVQHVVVPRDLSLTRKRQTRYRELQTSLPKFAKNTTSPGGATALHQMRVDRRVWHHHLPLVPGLADVPRCPERQ